jgi:WD40-like Beta Propeller Repeat
MNQTEDRLTDALHAAARSVTALGLRPLDDAPPVHLVRANPRTSRHRWLAAAASAAAVALIAGLAVVVPGRLHTSPDGAAAGAPPRYYAEEGQGHLDIRATATGRVTAVVPNPRPWGGQFSAVTTADDQTFFAAYAVPDGLTALYRFQVSAAGRVSRLALVAGGYSEETVTALAVSPDGTQLAVGIGPGVLASRQPVPDRVVVYSTRTGASITFRGGRVPRHQDPRSVKILQLSWTADGRELVYLARWTCRSPNASQICDMGPLGGWEQVRTLNPASRGGPLSSGRLLVNAPGGYVGAAAISPDGRTLAVVQVVTLASATTGPAFREFLIARYDARTGHGLRILGRVRTSAREMVSSFAPGPSGQYLIVVNGTRIRTPTVNGWLARGRLHRLAPAGRYVSTETW